MKGASFTLPATALGWYINLPYVPAADSGAGSERVHSDSEMSEGRIIFVSNAPIESDADPDPCETVVGKGKSWLNILDALTGKRLDETFLKVDEQGKITPITVTDPVTGETIPGSSREMDVFTPGTTPPIPPSDSLDPLRICTDKECFGLSLTRRVTWRQLQFP